VINRTHTRDLVLVLGGLLAGCDGNRAPGSSSPTPVQPTPAGVQLAGSVSDAAWRPLAGARVEVVDGPQAGLSTTTDGAGGFRLAGAFDSTTRFRATKEGHLAATWPLPQSCAACNPNWWIHFYLEAIAPHPTIVGDYGLTFIADSACTDFPDEVRTRRFGATVTLASAPDEPDQNSRFTVTLTGSIFLERYRSFTIGVAGDYIAAYLGDAHGTPGLIEQIAPNTYLTLDGAIRASVADGSTISSSLSGVVDRCELSTEWGPRYSCDAGDVIRLTRCSSQNHQLILTRR
jgi:hypothetical protein